MQSAPLLRRRRGAPRFVASMHPCGVRVHTQAARYT